MISERTFSNRYTSFWTSRCPFLDRQVRLINAGDAESINIPMSSVGGIDRGLLNEAAFLLFAGFDHTRHSTTPRVNWTVDEYQLAVTEANSRVGRYESRGARSNLIELPHRNSWAGTTLDFHGLAGEEVRELASRMVQVIYVEHGKGRHPIVIAPEFRGCGLIDACQGDVLVGDLLFEIKAGDRNFKAADVRQILTYCALSYAANSHKINSVALYNPRRGKIYISGVGHLIRQISTRSPSDFFDDIIRFIGSEELSC